MPTYVEIKPETADMLAAKARARGISVDEYLKTLLGMENARECVPEPTSEEFMIAMESLAEDDIKPLPGDFSRKDIYFPEG